MLEFLLIFAVSFLAGAINSIAGGGTFLTFPALLFIGVPPVVANATSTVALWPASLAYTFQYRKRINEDKKFLMKILLISFIGAVVGAVILLTIPEDNFKSLVPWLLLFATLIFTFGKHITKIIPKPSEGENQLTKWRVAILACCSVYGGFFGAGMGIVILALLEFMGFKDIHRMNALKGIIAIFVNGVAVAVFLIAGIVDYKLATIMLLGAVSGGYAGSTFALKLPADRIKLIIIAISWIITVYSFYGY
jgi:uncharacterized membrane protein YfcA